MSSIFPGDLWSVGEARIDGLSVIVRFRTGLPSASARQANDNLIIISGRTRASNPACPMREDKQHTNNFEEAIEKGFEDSPSACRWRA